MWKEADYSNFAPNGSPQTTTHKGVALTHAGTTSDLNETASYDNFGNLLSNTDTGGRTTATNSYDIAGELLTSCDASELTTNYLYDNLGNQTQSWQSVQSSTVKHDWLINTYDSAGNVLTKTTEVWAGGLAYDVQSVVTNTYDGSGDQLTSTDTTVSGLPEKWIYDSSGNVTSQWALGTAALNNDYDSARATVDSYDASGQVTSETAPGNSNATTSTYDLAGNLLKQDNPDGSFTRYTYDSDGNKLSEVTPLSNYDPQNPNENIAETTSSYDLADRLIAEVDPSRLETDHSYDLLGREISATGQSGQTRLVRRPSTTCSAGSCRRLTPRGYRRKDL